MAPIGGALAADSVIQAPGRTSSTVAALMFSLSMAMGLGGLARSTLSSVEDWMSATLNAPLFVTASESSVATSFHFPAAMLAQLREIDGVEEVQPVRNLKINIGGNTALLLSTDLAGFSGRTRARRVVEGNYQEKKRPAERGEAGGGSEKFAGVH